MSQGKLNQGPRKERKPNDKWNKFKKKIKPLALVAIPTAGLLIIACLIWPNLLCVIPCWCPKSSWDFEASAFPNAPSREQVFSDCGLAEYGFTKTSFNRSIVDSKMADITNRIKTVLEQKHSGVFASDSGRISNVHIKHPNSPADGEQVLVIVVEKKIAVQISNPVTINDKYLKEFVNNKVVPIIDKLNTRITSTANEVKQLSPSHEGRDLPLLYLIQAEMVQNDVPFDIPDKFLGNIYLLYFINNSYRQVANPQGHKPEYDQSYAYWLDALVSLKKGEVKSSFANNWQQRLTQLADLAKAYKETAQQTRDAISTGPFAGCRVDGSVLTLAMYTVLTVRLECWNKLSTEEHVQLYFSQIAEHLLEACRLLEKRSGSDLVTQSTTLTYVTGPGQEIFGGRLLYFTLAAQLATGDRQKELLGSAISCREYFKENSNSFKESKLDPYLYCYLVRCAATNARICASLGHDNWADEWTVFLGMAFNRCGTTSKYSNYYRILGDLAARNSLKDELKNPNTRWKKD